MIPHWIPYLGRAVDFGLQPVDFLAESRKKYGDVFTFIMCGRKLTFALGTEGNNFVLNAKHTHVNAEEAYRSLTKPVFGEGVVYDCPNHLLMEQKKFAKDGLSFDALRTYVDYIVEETRDYFARWDKNSDVGVVDQALAELIIMTASRCLMGKEIRAQLDETVADIYHDLDNGFQPINFLFNYLPLPSYRKRDEAHVKMRDLFLRIIQNRRKTNDMSNQDLLQTFMDAQYKDGKKMTDKEVAHMMIAVLMAGQHTSSTTTTWLIMHLARDPKLRAQLYEEQKTVFGEELGPLTFDGLNKCTLLDSVLKEVLRIHPPIVAIFRKVSKPIAFPNSNIVIPAGHYLCSSPFVTQVSEEHYEKPLEFDPSRWLKKDNTEVVQDDSNFGVVGKGTNSPYLPFGAGRHRCIGEPFAYVQIKTIVSQMIRMFEIEQLPDAKFPEPDFSKLFITPKGPVKVKYTKRA
ncbi:14-alpha sterol demethylase Cyp51B [Basidiobolus meristosporus CBS 931.73]|uniref:14-alpha sterol demethylase Cyp51B n=1 Tax=Basidiobolus meristosporus CBS 931.73 TaxID=1314790 RepID=A0A1Y1Y3R7_9FUNG|nr:14-alpha sterol demethylase Cyp51B [Basidiobolus meristosporus CBS 931.73]|eukprot:ORX92671.1 14-alpha sterol demethylase Cyp51B [Basidiobolus meristosporus CBS 931.73]